MASQGLGSLVGFPHPFVRVVAWLKRSTSEETVLHVQIRSTAEHRFRNSAMATNLTPILRQEQACAPVVFCFR